MQCEPDCFDEDGTSLDHDSYGYCTYVKKRIIELGTLPLKIMAGPEIQYKHSSRELHSKIPKR